jgi:mannose/cellobiose epimerase-like protein (N-acyl-D-glucosamine 2-epimerase family)
MNQPRFHSDPDTLRGAARAKAWLIEQVLPFWGEQGVDPRGGFHERLTATGVPDTQVPKRLRVQARQVFVYAHATRMGWYDGRQAAERAADFILSSGRPDPGRPAYACLLTPEGQIADPTIDTYDQVFVVFAFVSLYQATGDAEALRHAHEALGYLEEVLGDPVHGGFREAAPDRAPRRQNPHMHAFETFLTLFEATGDGSHLHRAEAIFTLFRERFFDAKIGALREYFDDDWSPLDGPSGQVCEPGHEMEWVWLLHRYRSATGRDIEPYAEALFKHAERFGQDRVSGFLLDQITIDGKALRASRRLWPQTEFIKALCERSLAGCAASMAHVDTLFDRSFEAYLGRPVQGAWIDSYGADGVVTGPHAPASTLYHLVGAISEADRALLGASASTADSQP